MKRFKFLVIILSLCFITIQAQTFEVRNIEFGENVPEWKQQKMRKDALGGILKLTEYDNDIKLEEVDKDGSIIHPIILHKTNDNKYNFKNDGAEMEVSIEKFLGYYKALTVTIWEKGNYTGTVYLKRKQKS